MNRRFYKNCGNCACFSRDITDRPDDTIESNANAEKWGECHRYPPYVLPTDNEGGSATDFPRVCESERCFEHRDIGLG